VVLIKQLTEDAQYDFIANIYPGMSAFDYLTQQLAIWINNGHEEFNVEFNRECSIVVNKTETVSKSLRETVTIIDHLDDIAKSLHISCASLQSPAPEPDETGAVTLWYDVIDFGSKRAERSLIRILDKYMQKDSDPYKNVKTEPKVKPKKPTNGRQHKRKARRT